MRDGLAHDPGGVDAGLFDKLTVLGVVATVHTTSSQVDENIGCFEFYCPVSQRGSVPRQHTPCRLLWLATENNDLVSRLVECTGENSSDLTCAARDDYFHVSRHEKYWPPNQLIYCWPLPARPLPCILVLLPTSAPLSYSTFRLDE